MWFSSLISYRTSINLFQGVSINFLSMSFLYAYDGRVINARFSYARGLEFDSRTEKCIIVKGLPTASFLSAAWPRGSMRRFYGDRVASNKQQIQW